MSKDRIRVREADPMYSLIPHFLRHRYESCNMITVDIPEQPLRQYMNQKRREGTPVSHLALILTAYLRLIEEYPALNRFVTNRKLYKHVDITVAMVVLRPSGEDAMSKIVLDYNDTVFTVQEKLTKYIDENKSEEQDNTLDVWMKRLCSLGFILRFASSVLRFIDNHGLLPVALVHASPFHASLLISNLASIRTNQIYHHIYEFGSTSVSMTLGNMREVPKLTNKGIIFERCIPIGVVMDERIASGHYFASAFARFRQLLSKPELLETVNPEGKKPAAEGAVI